MLTKDEIETLRQQAEKAAMMGPKRVDVSPLALLEILDDRDDVMHLAEELDAKDTKIEDLKDENAELRQEIKDLNREISALDGGGDEEEAGADGYPYG